MLTFQSNQDFFSAVESLKCRFSAVWASQTNSWISWIWSNVSASHVSDQQQQLGESATHQERAWCSDTAFPQFWAWNHWIFFKRCLDNLKPAIWYLNETVWQFAAMFAATEQGNLDHKLFLALTKWFLWLNPTGPQHCHNITLKMTPNENVKFIIFLYKLGLIPELLTHPTSVLYFIIY